MQIGDKVIWETDTFYIKCVVSVIFEKTFFGTDIETDLNFISRYEFNISDFKIFID
jgi:hypothetical protein